MTETPTPAPAAAAPESLRYGEALQELRTILDGIEREDIDLDELSDKVERAALLIRSCRERIERTEQRVQRVLDDLRKADAPTSASAADPVAPKVAD